MQAYLEPGFAEGLRQEILNSGFVRDDLLATERDVPVFGLNLACAWPFPESLRNGYAQLAEHLAQLGPDVYVYSYEQTHVTIATLVDFGKHRRPSDAEMSALQHLPEVVIPRIAALFEGAPLPAFRRLEFEFFPPIIERSAAFIPIKDLSGQVVPIREAIRRMMREVPGIELNVPKILHATVMRFLVPPPDRAAFIAAFDHQTRSCRLGRAFVDRLLLTAETSPYMRSGSKLHEFRLPA
jgi:hypothetical protein